MRKLLVAVSIALACSVALGQSTENQTPTSSPGVQTWNYVWDTASNSWVRLKYFPVNTDSFNTASSVYQGTFSIPYIYNGTSLDRARSIAAADTGITGTAFVGVPAVHQSTAFFNATSAAWTEKAWLGNVSGRIISATNTQIQQTFEIRQLKDSIALTATCSAGTAALTVESSVDNSNWLTIDSLVAAATNTKQYVAGTVGATLALSPLSFQFIRLTVATCGIGNTSTFNFSIK